MLVVDKDSDKSKWISCRLCNVIMEGVVASSDDLCGLCEKKYYDAYYERQDLISEYLKAKGRI